MTRLLLALVVACSTLTAPTVADACGNSVMASLYRRLRLADDALEDGNYKKAARLARRELTELEDARASEATAVERARRILALAAVRSSGTVPIRAGVGGPTTREQEAALAWAADVLRKRRLAAAEARVECVLDPARCDENADPVANAELAEALARVPDGRDQALVMLDQLATADLVPSPEAWAALARLRGERGDAAGQAAASARCRQVAARARRCDAA